MKADKFNWNEVYRILDDLNSTGVSIGSSLYRDTVNHYYEIAHRNNDPTCIVVTNSANNLLANYSIKHVVIVNNTWTLQ